MRRGGGAAYRPGRSRRFSGRPGRCRPDRSYRRSVRAARRSLPATYLISTRSRLLVPATTPRTFEPLISPTTAPTPDLSRVIRSTCAVSGLTAVTRPTRPPSVTTGMFSLTPSRLPRLMIDESNQTDGSRPIMRAVKTLYLLFPLIREDLGAARSPLVRSSLPLISTSSS